jgi:hypothetical protein
MFALVKPDLRACTRLLSVAAADRLSPLLLLAARHCCWIWMLMEPALHLDPATRVGSTLLQLLQLHATAAARSSAAACPAVLAAALVACTNRQQHWELAKTVLLAT